MQLYDVLQHGYWHARGHQYLSGTLVRVVEWARLPGDLVFIFAGVVPLVIATLNAYIATRRVSPGEAGRPALEKTGRG